MEQTKDYHSEFKASFIALGDKITKAIEDANQALIANNISNEKSNKNLLSNKDDRDRMSQKRFFDKLGKIADELGKEVGDKVNIISDNQTYCMEVCGIYQDVTSGGKTAKAIYDFEGELSEEQLSSLDNLSEELIYLDEDFNKLYDATKTSSFPYSRLNKELELLILKLYYKFHHY